MICDACNHNCQCPRRLHTGEAKALVGFTARELRYLLDGCGDYALSVKLERALELIADPARASCSDRLCERESGHEGTQVMNPTLKWERVDDRFWVVRAGLLHAGTIKDGQTWNWWVGTDDAKRDKADEHALKQGIHTRRPDALRDAEVAMEQLIRETADALGLNVE